MARSFRELFPGEFPLVGVVHLPALPGSPGHVLSRAEIGERAEKDAAALVSAGFDGLIVENFGDHPFFPEAVEPHTIALMALLVERVCQAARRLAPGREVPVGVNVLRNDARAALGIAAATGAAFVRVNVHVGAMVTDQGILQGKAHETLRYRAALACDAAVFADVLVKHAHPLGPVDAATLADDTFHRGGAAALVLSGSGTGKPVDREEARGIRAAVPEAPLLVGSGLTPEALPSLTPFFDGAIVGTSAKRGARAAAEVDPARARALVAARDARGAVVR